jgi:hypothetical protein
MASARKGSGQAPASFEIGDIVLGRLKGFPLWREFISQVSCAVCTRCSGLNDEMVDAEDRRAVDAYWARLGGEG